MKTLHPPQTDLEMSTVILGMMRIAELDNQQIRTLVGTARDAGITVFDHADVYGKDHRCERRFGEALGLHPADREQIVLQSKVGLRPGFRDLSMEHILRSVDESLAALGTDYLDVLLLHRPDALVEPEEVAAAFDMLKRAGKVRHFGVSNHTPGQIEMLRRAIAQPLAFDQVQLSIVHAPLIAAGLSANMADLGQSVDRDNGLVDYARREGVTLQAWSPFQKGFFSGTFLDDRENHAPLNDALDEIAAAHGVTPTGIALAWITRHPADIQVVLGTTTPQRVVDAAAGADVRLTREEWYRLFTAAGNALP